MSGNSKKNKGGASVPTMPPPMPPSTPPVATLPSAAAATSVTPPAYEFKLVIGGLEELEQHIAGEEVIVPAVVPSFSVNELVRALPLEITELGGKGRGLILGVNASMMLRSFLIHLILAREQGNPAPLLYCGVLAVAVAYTVSREWVEEYDNLPGPHMFSQYEVDNRKVILGSAHANVSKWIEDSSMNASALRIFGSMIIEAGSSDGFCKMIKEEAGTIFNPPSGEKPRDVIMKEAAKEVSDSDREALSVFKEIAAKYAAVVGAIFGAGTLEVKTYVDIAKKLGEVVI